MWVAFNGSCVCSFVSADVGSFPGLVILGIVCFMMLFCGVCLLVHCRACNIVVLYFLCF